MNDKAVLLQGDCLEVLKDLPDNSVDSLITDPPAGISFMGKAWDEDKGGRKQWVKWMSDVMTECLRVLKPGAHGLVWAIPRTSHWTATALEDAGFEIRDVVTHLFGSGFPKSLDISKAIDKAAGAEREVTGEKVRADGKKAGLIKEMNGGSFSSNEDKQGKVVMETAPATPEAKQWQGWGTALKPASEHWILVRKPISEKTVAANVLEHGTGGINIDASRIGLGEDRSAGGLAKTPTYKQSGGNQTERPTGGRFPANLVFSHNPDCVEVGVKKVKTDSHNTKASSIYGSEMKWSDNDPNRKYTETVSSFECTPGCAVAELDRQSGVSKSTGGKKGGKIYGSFENMERANTGGLGDSGGSSRFFYCAKASKKDKGADNTHPTVKSSTLMSYLIKLITPPNGLVLDPFMGSGSTGVAAVQNGFDFIGIEKEQEYYDISEKRLKSAA